MDKGKGKGKGKDKKNQLPQIYSVPSFQLNDLTSFWQKQLDSQTAKASWYENANQYWTKSEATYNGVLGGYSNLSPIDIKFSLKFILELVKDSKLQRDTVLDCGAGIGRVSKQLLCQVFKTVDIVDQCQKLVQQAKIQLKSKSSARHFYCCGLQSFTPTQKYSVIWIQWVLSHLSDEDAIAFLKRCKEALTEGGLIILKENYSRKGFDVDKVDYSVTRSRDLLVRLGEQAGMKIVKQAEQEGWPKDLLGVKMIAFH